MHIREASPGDATDVRPIANAACHDAHNDIVGPDTVDDFLDVYYDPQDLRGRYRDGDSTTFVAEVNGHIVGCATGVMTSDSYELGSIYVDPEHQGRALGALSCHRSRNGRATATVTLSHWW